MTQKGRHKGTPFQVYLPDELLAAAKAKSRETKTPLAKVVREALEAWVAPQRAFNPTGPLPEDLFDPSEMVGYDPIRNPYPISDQRPARELKVEPVYD
jgi:hypothetical protein